MDNLTRTRPLRQPPTPGRRWLAGRVGRRGSVLIFFALIDADIAWSLIVRRHTEMLPPWTVGADRLLDPSLWALLWAATSVACCVHAFRRSDRVGYAAATLTKMLWGLLYLGAAAIHREPTALVPGAFWLAMAGWVIVLSRWSEPPPEGRRG